MFAAIMAGDVTSEKAAALEKFMDLHERAEKRNAEREFNAAFAEFQKATKQVTRLKPVGNKYRYAPTEDIMREAKPHMDANGFSLSYSQKMDKPGIVTVVCVLSHIGGHSRTNEFSARCSPQQGGSDREADVGASTVAQREAICDALGIVRNDDGQDARLIGQKVTAEQAATLKDFVVSLGRDEKKFLAWATGNQPGAKYSDIPACKFDEAIKLLKEAEKKGTR
jgi:hypothetical protein